MGLEMTGGREGSGRRWRTSRQRPASSRRAADGARVPGGAARGHVPQSCWRLRSRPVEAARLSAGLADLAGPRGLGGEAVALGALAAACGLRVAAYAAARRRSPGSWSRRRTPPCSCCRARPPWLAAGQLASEARGSTSRPRADRLPSSPPGWWTSPAASRAPSRARRRRSTTRTAWAAGAGGRAAGRLSEAGRAVASQPVGPAARPGPASVADLVGAQADLGARQCRPLARPRGRGAPARRVVGLGGHHPRHPGLVAAGRAQPVGPHHAMSC